MPSISIIGVGRVGGALAIALTDAGYDLQSLIHRGNATADRIAARLAPSTQALPDTPFPPVNSEIVLITTADPDIAHVANVLAENLDHRPVILHTSGSLSSEVLVELADLGCSTGSMHPLVSISDPVSGSGAFRDVYFCVEGSASAGSTAREIVAALGGRVFAVESKLKSLYHAAAVMASGHFTALIDAAIEMLTECGIEKEEAQRILVPLIDSTAVNLKTQTPGRALTGTFARADVETFYRHLTSMTANSPDDIRTIYLILAERSLKLAAANGANTSDIQKIREGISIAKEKSE